MTHNRISGIALIAGSLGALLTMAIHPTGGGTLAPSQIEHLALASELSHSLALVSVLILALGACGLAFSLAARDGVNGPDTQPDHLAVSAPTLSALVFSALVVFFFAAVAIMIAATVSGFIFPAILRHMARDTAAAAPIWKIVMAAIFQFNQAFANIYTVGVAVSMALWSIAGLRHGGLQRGLAIYGCIMAPLVVLAIASGHLKLDVHGMAIVVVAQGIWFLAAGAHLINSASISVPGATPAVP